MTAPCAITSLNERFRGLYGRPPEAVASAAGRIEVLGNHTDYNAGLTLSCAVGFRCYAALTASDQPIARLSSTMLDAPPESFPIDGATAPKGHWANYVLGLVAALRARGHDVPGFDLLVDSAVPRSAGMSSSAALEMSVLTGLVSLMQVGLPPIELARIGQQAESEAVGAQTGLLDQLTSLLGKRDRLLQIDFRSLETHTTAVPAGWCFVAIDSGITHDLTAAYNDRRESCEAAARAMGVATLREADERLLESHRLAMAEPVYGCAAHVIGENRRVKDAVDALAAGDIDRFGALMFASHESSRDNFRNSYPQLDELVAFARGDDRCVGARLSGGGFGGITIHLVKTEQAEQYRKDLLSYLSGQGGRGRWSAICSIDDGAQVHP